MPGGWPADRAIGGDNLVDGRGLGCQPGQVLTDAVINGYWENYRLKYMVDPPQEAEADLHFWCWDVVNAVVDGPDEIAVPLLVALAEAGPDDPSHLEFLGADAIENYLTRTKRPPDIDAIVRAAEQHPKLRVALRAAWYRSTLSDADTARLQAFGVSPREGPGPRKRRADEW
jgi:hypothetical protein